MIPNEIKILPKINVDENSNITKSLTPKYYSNNLLAYENEHSNTLLEKLEFNYDNNIESLNVDFLKILDKEENNYSLNTSESKKIVTGFVFNDYQIKKLEDMITLENLIVIDGNSFSSTTDIDYLIIDSILHNYITKSLVDETFIYVHNLDLDLISSNHTYHGCKRNSIERIYLDKKNILNEKIKLVSDKELISSKTFENTTNTTWTGYKLTSTSKVTDIEGFEYVDSNHFKAVEKLETGYKLLNLSNMPFMTTSRMQQDSKYFYSITSLNNLDKSNHHYHELNAIDKTIWKNINTATQEDKETHRLTNNDKTNTELNLDKYENCSDVTIKMRVYSNGVWNKETDYFYILANGEEIIRLYQGGEYPIIKSNYNTCHWRSYAYQYISNPNDLWDSNWTKNNNTDSKLYYWTNYCSASWGWHIASRYTYIKCSAYKDISITIPYEKYINLTIGCKLSRNINDNISSPNPNIGANMSVDFRNFEILVNNANIKKQAKNTYRITNHKLESIDDISTDAISVEYDYPYIKEEFNMRKLVGDTYEFKVIKENEDSFHEASIETYTKNAFMGDTENKIKTS